MASSAAPLLGEIEDGVSYALPRFMGLTGQGRKSIAKAKADGLEITRIGRRSYILGRNWIAYLARKAIT